MGRIDNLTNFVTDIAGAIRTTSGETEDIPCSEFSDRILNLTPEEGYVRTQGVPNGEEIIANASVIENGGINYYPIYYVCLYDILTTETFKKTWSDPVTGDNASSGADAFVFSDEPLTLYVGDTTHTFNTANDYATVESWKCRYVIMYATEANKNVSTGITVNLGTKTNIFEIIGSQYLILSNTSALSHVSNEGLPNLQYANLQTSDFDNSISDNFCVNSYSLQSLLLPAVTSIGNNFCSGSVKLEVLNIVGVNNIGTDCFSNCKKLKSLNLPNLTSIGDRAFNNCVGLKSLYLPNLTSTNIGFCSNCESLELLSVPNLTNITSGFCGNCALKSLELPMITTIEDDFCNSCYNLLYYKIPNTLTSITSSEYASLSNTKFIELPDDFNLDNCNFSYSEFSTTWFTHLAQQLKDNSSGTAKTMTLGAANIALIPIDIATAISNKNWTIN